MSNVYLLSRTRSINRMARTWCIPTAASGPAAGGGNLRMLSIMSNCINRLSPVSRAPPTRRPRSQDAPLGAGGRLWCVLVDPEYISAEGALTPPLLFRVDALVCHCLYPPLPRARGVRATKALPCEPVAVWIPHCFA